MKQYDIGIDLGTTSIIIATEEQGVVFRQPTIGAVDTRTNSILAVGDEALKMVGRAPAHIDLVRPLRDGIIQDHRMTNELIVRFVNQVCRSRIFKPRIAVCVPAAITGIEADAVVESVMAAGARQVYLVDEPVAAALGAGLQIRQPHGCMVVDIGGGSTDIAVISMGGRVKAASLPVAGNAFDSCIAQYVQEKYQIAIGPLTAEQLKKQVACCTRSEFEGVMEVRGHSWETNLPARRIIYTRDLYEPVQELAARIANAARNVLESTPPELAADVSGTGILLTGGGSLLRGLAGYIAGELHTDVAIAPDPLNCVARGTAISLSEGKYLSAGFRDATPKVWNRRLNHSHDPFTGEKPLTAWPTREAYADGSGREPYAAHVGAGHARPCTSPQTHGTGKTAFLAPSGRGLLPQRVGERTSRLSEIFRAMARFSPSGPAGPPPSQREAGGSASPQTPDAGKPAGRTYPAPTAHF